MPTYDLYENGDIYGQTDAQSASEALEEAKGNVWDWNYVEFAPLHVHVRAVNVDDPQDRAEDFVPVDVDPTDPRCEAPATGNETGPWYRVEAFGAEPSRIWTSKKLAWRDFWFQNGIPEGDDRCGSLMAAWNARIVEFPMWPGDE